MGLNQKILISEPFVTVSKKRHTAYFCSWMEVAMVETAVDSTLHTSIEKIRQKFVIFPHRLILAL